MTMGSMSPRIDAPGQTETSSCNVTAPEMNAVGAIQHDGWTFGALNAAGTRAG